MCVIVTGKRVMRGNTGAYKFLHLLLHVIPSVILPSVTKTNLSELFKPLLQYQYKFQNGRSNESTSSVDEPENLERVKNVQKETRYKFWWLFEICTMSRVDA